MAHKSPRHNQFIQFKLEFSNCVVFMIESSLLVEVGRLALLAPSHHSPRPLAGLATLQTEDGAYHARGYLADPVQVQQMVIVHIRRLSGRRVR